MKNRFWKTLNAWIGVGMLVISSLIVHAQHTPPSPYTSNVPVSFIRTWDALAPETDPNLMRMRPLKDVRTATQYVDGLGKPLQTVLKQGSMISGGNPFDLVTAAEYDELGREQFKWLPFASSENTGAFKLNPFVQQASFYNDPNGVLKGQGENYFYGHTILDGSPLSRVSKTLAPGVSWVGSSRGVEQKYWYNTTNDDVKNWVVTDVSGNFGNYSLSTVNNGKYYPNELYKMGTVDEHGRQVLEFKNKEGNVILKKVQINPAAGVPDDGTGRGYTEWICTYYIYDIFGSLRCVIQPEGVKAMATGNNWTLNSTQLNEQCFRYEYDELGRMTMKKVPGAAAVYMVYDQRDRVVMVQDGNLAAQGKWLVTLYDNLNRPVQTGLWTNNNTQAYHATQAAASSNVFYPFDAATVPGTGWDKLTAIHYDNYTGLPAPLSQSFNTSWSTYFQAASNTSYPYPQAQNINSITTGLTTWTETKVLNSSQYLLAVMLYDEKGRVIQAQSTNLTGGVDIATTQYSWGGQPLTMVQKVEKASSPNPQTTVVVTTNTYDDLGRLLKVEKKLSNTLVNGGAMPSSFKTIVQNEYDQLGRLRIKKLGTKPNTSSELESMTYDYNIRGWMLGANRDYAKDGNNNNYFGFDLGYDKANNSIIGNQTYSNPQYNGNIEGMAWKSKGDGEKRKYDFVYDPANRLLRADFTQYTGGVFDQTAGVNFNVKMGNGIDYSTAYDANGNILRMQQWGLKINQSDQIDDLSYNYIGGSNRLLNVIDSHNDNATKLGDFRASAYYQQTTPVKTNATVDYAYDINGNLNRDWNKDIESITYNHLNLPVHIRVLGGGLNQGGQPVDKGYIEYVYDALGNKLIKTVQENQGDVVFSPKSTLYLSGLVYQEDELQFVPQEEGRIRFKPASGSIAASFQYDYMIKDHLGNVRMVLTEEQQQDVYPAVTLENTGYNNGTAVNVENLYYTIDNSKIVSKSAVTGITNYQNNNGNPPYNNNPYSNATANSDKLYKLNSNSNKTGLGITLKVMAGDKIDVFGKSYYFTNTNGTGGNNTIGILDLLTSFLGAPNASTVTSIHGGVTANQINTTGGTAVINGMVSQQNSQSNANPNRPRAFINIIFFDEQFKSVDYKISMVGSNSILKEDHYVDLQNLTAMKSGFVYIYCSNESPVDVFFDNLQVIHTKSAILEETHYYPFGLMMAGISSKAAGTLSNRFKFNGKEEQRQEFSDGSGLELIDYGARIHDNQIGRFLQVDPSASSFPSWNPYNYCFSNPLNIIDPDGRTGEPIIDHKNKTVTIQSNLIFYGGAATKDRASRIAKSIEKQWNCANAKFKVKDKDGKESEYKVVFSVTSDIMDESFVQDYRDGKMAVKMGAKDNLVRLELEGADKWDGNSGFLSWNRFENDETTAGHEYGHGLDWFDNSQNYALAWNGHHDHIGYYDESGLRNPGIMTPGKGEMVRAMLNATSSQVGSINWINMSFFNSNGVIKENTRAVTKSDIQKVLRDYKPGETTSIGNKSPWLYTKNGAAVYNLK